MTSDYIKCPVCSKVLEESEREYAAKQLEKSILQEYRSQLKKGKQENAAKLARFKQMQHEQMQVMARRHQGEKKSLQKRLIEQAKKGRESQKREVVQLRRNYQMQLEQVRDFYGTQNATLQTELKSSFAAQMEVMKKNYESLASGNQRQLETLQKYIEETLVGELREKIRQMEDDKISAELRLAEMVQQLDQRNAEFVSLNERLSRVDAVIPEEPARMPNQSEIEEQGGNQQELLRIVKEVAEQQELGELGQLEEDVPNDDGEKHSFWGKPGKKFGLF